MERLLARLERRLGRFAIPNLAYVVYGGMGFIFLLSFVRPELEPFLKLDVHRVLQGQVWRLVTFIFLPPRGGGFLFPDHPFWTILGIYMFWMVASNLESHWGAFKLNAFYFLGLVGTIAAASISGMSVSNGWLNMSLFLAFATVFPDEVFQMFFILPVKAKWLGILDAALLGWALLTGDVAIRLGIAFAFANYTLFFAGFWLDWYKRRNLQVRQAARRAGAPPEAPTKAGARTCAICGASEDEGADIRVCSCDKCGGKPRNLCLPHARAH
jgi:hypothetical protein